MTETDTIAPPRDPDDLPGVEWINDPALRERQFPDPEYLIPGELPCGYTLMMAAPKVGKTAMSLGIGHKIAKSGRRVLYLVMDDSLRRMRTRSIMALPATSPEYSPMDGLWYVSGWTPKGLVDAFAQLSSWLTRWADVGTPFDLVIVDTYGQFAGRKPTGVDVFGHDNYIGQQFKIISERHKTSVFVNHHTRKGAAGGDDDWLDMMSGSAGMAAAADAIWYLSRVRGTRSGMLRITGNDMEEVEKPLVLGPDMVWRMDHTITPAQARHQGTPRAVLDYMMGQPQATVEMIRQAVDANQNTVHQSLQRLSAEGLVIFLAGAWELTGHPDNQLPVDVEPVPVPPVVVPLVDVPAADGPADAGTCPGPLGKLSGTLAHPVRTAPIPAPRDGQLCEDAIAPAPVGDGATAHLVKTLTESRLHVAFKLSDQVKEKIPYSAMCLGGKSNQWALWPRKRPAGTVVVFDRKASYFSSKVWVVPNILTRCGPLDWDEIRARRLAGVFEIAPTAWQHPNLPSPYGKDKPRARELVTRGMLNRLRALTEAGLMDFPRVLSGYVGKGSENCLKPWMDWCLAQRREAGLDRELAALRKDDQNLAIGSMRIVSEGKAPGVVDRWDWQYEIHSTHYAAMHRVALASLEALDPLIAVGNTDELVYLLPDGENPAVWAPAALIGPLERGQFARKSVRQDTEGLWHPDRDAAGWFDSGGRSAQR